MNNDTHILVIDDDEGIRSLLHKYLQKNGYRVTAQESALHAREILQHLKFDLLIVDVMMPDETGTKFTESLRQGNGDLSSVPILMLTAKGEGQDRIDGLLAGADDYLSKPFEPQELLLRIQAILRRSILPATAVEQVHFGSHIFDTTSKKLQDGEARNIYLTEGECELLHVLASRPNQPISREDIMRLCGYDDGGGGRAIDVQMTRLRRKLEADPKRPQYLMTIRNKGYLLRSDT